MCNIYSDKLHCIERFWKLISKDRLPQLKDFALMFGAQFLPWSTVSAKSKNRYQVTHETLEHLDNNLRLQQGYWVWCKKGNGREALTTVIPLIDICINYYCVIISMTRSLPFSISNLGNLLFYTSFCYYWPASFHVLENGPLVKPCWITLH